MSRTRASLLVLTVVCLVGLSNVSAAGDLPNQGKHQDGGSETSGPGMRLTLLGNVDRADIDHQQILKLLGAKGLAAGSPDEIQAYKRVFNSLDTDDDGKLTKDEYIEKGRYGTRQMRTGIFRATDRDADEIVTEKEYVENRIITDEAKAIFEKIDRNSDGQLTESQFVENSPIKDEKTAREVFRKLDASGDGQITIPEYLRVWGNWARQGISLPLVRHPGQAIVYVDVDNAKGPWDGKSWATAYRAVQEGIDAAAKAGGGEAWVAKGTYKPTSTTDRAISFQLKSGVALYGGFKGTEKKRAQRDRAKHATVLSGDIGKPGDNGDNSYHVVKGADNVTIDGFTITGGNADGDLYDSKAGGMINYENYRSSPRRTRQNGGLRPKDRRRSGGGFPPGFGAKLGFSPTVSNCIFKSNNACEGGAMYNYDHSCPALTNCTFTRNSADKGGAIVNRVASNCKVTGCIFTRNYAKWRGGAVFNDYGCSPAFTNCTFTENSTDGNGGGMYTDDHSSQIGFSMPTVTNCTFTKNTAKLRGGGMANFNKCNPTVTGCTFTGNSAVKGGGGMANDYRVGVTVTNCTFNRNSCGEGDSDIDTDDTSVVWHSQGESARKTGGHRSP